MALKDMAGQRFGLITVVRRAENDKYGNARWLCRCDCGKEFVTLGHSIRNGHTRSCGHLQRDKASEMLRTHQMSKTALYKSWAGMVQRCSNPNAKAYKDYGARGITVCDEWRDFQKFYEWAVRNGYKPGLTIERMDNNKGYEPSNCTYATRAEQNRNTTRTHRIETSDGFITAAEAARIANLSRSTVAKWAREGLVSSLEEVLAKAEAHTMADSDFFEKYHIPGGIVMDKTLCKIYGLKTKRSKTT